MTDSFKDRVAFALDCVQDSHFDPNEAQELKTKLLSILDRLEYESTNAKSTPERRSLAHYILTAAPTDPMREILQQQRKEEAARKAELPKGARTFQATCTHCGKQKDCVECKGCENPVCARCLKEMKESGDSCL